jgi:hypothetical protein
VSYVIFGNGVLYRNKGSLRRFFVYGKNFEDGGVLEFLVSHTVYSVEYCLMLLA